MVGGAVPGANSLYMRSSNGQRNGFGVNQLRVRAATAQVVDQKIRQTYTHAIGAIGPVKDQNSVRHRPYLPHWLGCAYGGDVYTGFLAVPDAGGEVPN